MTTRRELLLAGAAWPLALQAQDNPTGGDPLGSMQYPSLRDETVGKAAVAFSDAVQVRGLGNQGGGVARIRVAVDRNPVRQVLDFEPLRALPMLAFRIRMEQASPVRAFVQTRDGRWHVGSTWVQAAGGGCTVPGATRADGSWSKTLGQVQARFFSNVLEGSRRLRLRVMHPMDTGLVAGIPAFYLEELQLVDGSGQAWWKLGLREPVSENPLITFELPPQPVPGLRLVGRDNNGNRIDAEVVA